MITNESAIHSDSELAHTLLHIHLQRMIALSQLEPAKRSKAKRSNSTHEPRSVRASGRMLSPAQCGGNQERKTQAE